ncbi:ABC transporter permease [Afifella marina]|uniref:Lipopolysaccharide transport system permease protein n=1 Tax=Afifella marina DSM 2698 TaxID=1120955 RepID=A0A1G5NBA0_AFIMA|nr:ABC transporter permease [Afifella marina]MBK1623204.1 ABC transporter permease [Afifella marina DSM 2698]MBK1626198.1 ABC transporter permease [Afifella marina]MBK5917076.1 ABC transporter permease [Afifella marina]RAI22067.1 ABC transporter permease [Afifella marina DSM 2698]SCZ34652.1 lipopolysaccharide transport system permease protein [Afifella marina DSM 2698]
MLKWLWAAFADLREGIAFRRAWMALAGEDITDQHRRTALGPIWLLINYLAFVGTFIAIFGYARGAGFSAYVALGFFVWMYLSEVINQSISLFVREENFIKGTRLPLSVYVFRLTMQSLIRAGYALIGLLGLLFILGTPITMAWMWSLIGILLIVAITPAAITVLAVAGAFFPDLQFVVGNVIRLGLFLTPIFWYPAEGAIRGHFYFWNPFTYFLEIVRVPITDGVLPLHAFYVCGLIGAISWLLALWSLGRFRRQIIFVL